MFLKLAALLAAFAFAVPTLAQQRPKILALHGGGGSGASFSEDWGMRDLEDSLPGFEFVYATGGYPIGGDNHLWILDPPGGKGQPTTDPAFSDDSIAALDQIRESQGPFAGILGYSQGAAYVPVYLSRVPADTFDFALMFCGYPTETHQGILEVVEEQAPFSVPSLIWIGEQDGVIPPGLTRETIPFFVSPTVVSSPQGDHAVPLNTDPTFSEVVSFISTGGGGVVGDVPTTSPVDVPTTSPVDNGEQEKPTEKPSDDVASDKPIGEAKPSEDYEEEKPGEDKPIGEEKPSEDYEEEKPGEDYEEEKPDEDKPIGEEKPSEDYEEGKPGEGDDSSADGYDDDCKDEDEDDNFGFWDWWSWLWGSGTAEKDGCKDAGKRLLRARRIPV